MLQDNVVPGTEWGALKPTTKWGQMAVLRLPDGSEMTQSKPMVRFLARTSKTPEGKALYPDDPKAAFQVDELMEAIDDVRNKVVPTFSISDQAEKEAARAALFIEGGAIFDGLKKMEENVTNDDGYFVGGKLTLADVLLFIMVNQFRAGFLDGCPKAGWLEKLPKLEKIVNTVTNTPSVKAYYSEKAASNKVFAAHAGQ
jgi:glutathione S-transferase